MAINQVTTRDVAADPTLTVTWRHSMEQFYPTVTLGQVKAKLCVLLPLISNVLKVIHVW